MINLKTAKAMGFTFSEGALEVDCGQLVLRACFAHRSVSNTPGIESKSAIFTESLPSVFEKFPLCREGEQRPVRPPTARPTWQWRFSKIWNATIFATAYGADVRFRG